MAIGHNHDTRVGFYLNGTPVQVVQKVHNNTVVTSNTSTWQSYTNLAQSITPKYVDSKILINLSASIYWGGASAQYAGQIGIFSSLTSTRIYTTDCQMDGRAYYLGQSQVGLPMTYLDSPNTLSTITYTPQYISLYGYSFGFGWGTMSYHSLTLMEIQQ